MADKRISELNPLSSADLDANSDVLAVADLSASETKKLTPTALIVGSVGVVPDGTIPGSKIEPDSITSLELAPDSVSDVELADNAVDTGAIQNKAVTQEKLADGAVGTDQLADGAVTANKIADGALGTAQIADRSIPAIKLEQNTLTAEEIAPNAIGASELADNAVDTPAVATDALATRHYQNASVTNEKLADGIDGGKLQDGSVPGSKLEPGSITGDALDEVPLDKLPDAGPNTVLAGPAGGGSAATPAYRSIVPDDLPTGTATTKGAVSVPAAGGLAVDGAGAVSIDNTVVAGGNPFVNYNSHGLITSSRPLSGTDLPPPAVGEIGGVKQGDGITITGDGTISQSVTGVAASEYTKVTVDLMGNVTAGAQLEASDIPNLDWSQIDNPELEGGTLLDKSVSMAKLANYSIAFIQEDQPVVTNPDLHAGCLWFQESTATLSMYNQNSWLSVGIGRLSAENLRYCGLINADTATITAVTQFGVAEGFEVGDAIPDPSDELTGVYFITEVAGSGIAKTAVSGKSFDEGDWLICNGATSGWERIDTSAGGGGGGASRLEDLLDVNVATKQPGALLQYQSNGTWQDIYAVDAGVY